VKIIKRLQKELERLNNIKKEKKRVARDEVKKNKIK